MRIIYGDLTPNVTNLDQALYVASCLCAASKDKTAHIYETTDDRFADDETGEHYLIFYGDDDARSQIDPAYTLAYSITRPVPQTPTRYFVKREIIHLDGNPRNNDLSNVIATLSTPERT